MKTKRSGVLWTLKLASDLPSPHKPPEGWFWVFLKVLGVVGGLGVLGVFGESLNCFLEKSG